MKAPVCLFNHLNQADPNKNHRMCCTIYSACINLYYNTGYKLNEKDIDIIVQDSVNKGILNLEKGGGLEDNFMNVFSYAKKKFPNIKYKIFNKFDLDYAKYLDLGYMIEIGIGVNATYTYDSQDNGILDEQDYIKLKGTIKHATNSLKWKKPSQDLNKHFIFDSYFGKKDFNLYRVDLKRLKESIMFQNTYLFYID